MLTPREAAVRYCGEEDPPWVLTRVEQAIRQDREAQLAEATQPQFTFYCDNARRLVCMPYSLANLHTMAARLGIKRHYYYSNDGLAHYTIPKRRRAELELKCTMVTAFDIGAIKRGTYAPPGL